MELAQLQYFRNLAITQSFTVSASELNISRSTLSSSIKALEEEFGCTLFERTGNSIRLNEDGKYLYNNTHTVFGLLNDCRYKMPFASSSKIVGKLSIGCFSGTMSLTECLGAFSLLHKDVLFDVITPPMIGKHGKWREMDFIFAAQHTQLSSSMRLGNYMRLDLIPHTYMLLLNKAHPLAKSDQLFLRDLANEDWVFIKNAQTYLYEEAYTICVNNGFIPNVKFTTERFINKVLLVANNTAITMVPKVSMKLLSGHSDLIGVPVHPAPGSTDFFQLRWDPEAVLSPIAQEFLLFVKDFYHIY